MRVTDRRGDFLGHAFYNLQSEITLRIATHEDESVDESWFRARIEWALAYRKSLEHRRRRLQTPPRRADGVPGLIMDRYGEYLVF